MGYSPWGRKGSDTTERLHLTLNKCPLGIYRKIRLKKERESKKKRKKREGYTEYLGCIYTKHFLNMFRRGKSENQRSRTADGTQVGVKLMEILIVRKWL